VTEAERPRIKVAPRELSFGWVDVPPDGFAIVSYRFETLTRIRGLVLPEKIADQLIIMSWCIGMHEMVAVPIGALLATAPGDSTQGDLALDTAEAETRMRLVLKNRGSSIQSFELRASALCYVP
jgi:hypothetical protein